MAQRGAPVVEFVKNDSVYDADTDTYSATTKVAVRGYAVRLDGTRQYQDGDLVVTEPVILFFIPLVAGKYPTEDSRVEWDGKLRTVRAVKPIQQVGVTIGAQVITS